MRRGDFDRFTDGLAEWAAEADGVLGLVLLGSTAATTHPPDDWSDHDVYVIAEPRMTEVLRGSIAWLPERDAAVVLHERDTAHGAWVVYDDGHLLEYAVFAPDELASSRSGAHRIVVDRRGDLAALMRPTLAPPPRDPATIASGLHRTLLVGAGRAARGERLAARRHLVDAAGALLTLAAMLARRERPLGDPQDPWRRVEQTDPSLAASLDGILARSDAVAALELARLAERVAGHQQWWPRALAAAVRGRLGAPGARDAAGLA